MMNWWSLDHSDRRLMAIVRSGADPDVQELWSGIVSR